MTCRTMQAVVASRFKSDCLWWKGEYIGYSEDEFFKKRKSLLYWYRFCGACLTEIDFGSGKRRDLASQNLTRVLHILISQPPPVSHLGLMMDPSVNTDDNREKFYFQLANFLHCIQSTLEHISLDFNEEVYNPPLQAELPCLISVSMYFKDMGLVRKAVGLLRSFARESSQLSMVCLYCNSIEPDDVVSIPPAPLPQEMLQVISELVLDSLTLCYFQLPQHFCMSIMSQSDLEDLHLINCSGESKGLKLLLSKPNVVYRLENWREFSSEDVQILLQCPHLKTLSVNIKISTGLLSSSTENLPRFKALSELRLTFLDWSPSQESEEWLVYEVCNCYSLRKLELCYRYSSGALCEEGLQASSIKQLLILQRHTLECLQVCMGRPLNQSSAHVITDLLGVVRKKTLKLKKLKIRVGVKEDKSERLLEQLSKAVCETEQAIEGLMIIIGGEEISVDEDLIWDERFAALQLPLRNGMGLIISSS